MDIENFFSAFSGYNLREFQKINFSKLYAEVAKSFPQWKLCNYCSKKKKYYFHSVGAYRESIKHIKFCSYGCLKKIMKDSGIPVIPGIVIKVK